MSKETRIRLSEHKISQALATAIFNDDYSGISASDNRHIEKWLRGYIRLTHDEEIYWTQCEITGSWSDCIAVQQVTEE